MVGTARARGDTGSRRLSGALPQEQQSLIDACGASLEQAAPGFNYRREMVLTRDLQIGDTVVVNVPVYVGMPIPSEVSLGEEDGVGVASDADSVSRDLLRPCPGGEAVVRHRDLQSVLNDLIVATRLSERRRDNSRHRG